MQKDICLHNYQLDITRRIAEAWHTHRSVMVQMPTGTGKTHVLASVVNTECNADVSGGYVWIMVHRRELVAQIEETLLRYGIPSASSLSATTSVRVMSIQWLARHISEQKERPALIVIDEAHHALAATYRELWQRYPEARKLGFTATPCRMNHSGFTCLFDVLVTSWSIAEFIRQGRLSAFDYISIRTGSREQMLIDSLEKRGADGDFQIKEMAGLFNSKPNIVRLYHSVRKFAHGKKGIVYAINIEHARSIAAYYNGKSIASAAIDSRTPAAERKRLVDSFKAGKVQVLVNVDVFSEGFDCPDVGFVQMARPTLSLAKYLQQVGRGLRKSEGKEKCIIIDNVGLYRMFGLPTADWDWNAMFCGKQAGKGIRRATTVCQCSTENISSECLKDNIPYNCDMEIIVSHDCLLSFIAEHREPQHITSPEDGKLREWCDKASGLSGLKSGMTKITDAVFLTVFDIRYDMAAVRFGNKQCGLVGKNGETIAKNINCRTMKFTRNHLLAVTMHDETILYVDLYNMRQYGKKPEVKRYGSVELLKIGGTYYSRTKNVYENNQNISEQFVTDHGFCITIFDYKAPDAYRCGHACILSDDKENFYWVFRWLADGSLIVTDGNGNYYHAGADKAKKYIGSTTTDADTAICMAVVERLARQAKDNILIRATEENAQRQQRLNEMLNRAVPFRSGMKWGLKIDGRIIVPPIYRNVKSPVGRYCAVEKNYSQWGVITLDGTLIIEPQYQDIEILNNGSVIGTKVTGRKMQLKLP